MGNEKGKAGIYVYCLINKGIKENFGNIGIKDNEVYTIPFKDIGAVVHKHSHSPQTSNLKPQTSEEAMVELAISHQHIIDMATEKFGTVIPFNPSTIIEGREEEVMEWLKRDYIKIKNTLKEVTGKAEFEIQVIMARDVLINRLKEESEELKRLKELKMNPGKAYVLGQRILREELEKLVDSVCRTFYAQISKCADKIQINKTAGALIQEKQPVMNLSCLIHEGKVKELKTVLKKIDNLEGFDAHLSGPWQPYNFVRL